MDLLKIFYSTAGENLLADCAFLQFVSESLKVTEDLPHFAYDVLGLILHLQGSVHLVHVLQRPL